MLDLSRNFIYTLVLEIEDQLLQEYILNKYILEQSNFSINLQGVSLCLVVGIVSAAKSNNDFKYSVAFVGVFAMDERPNSKKID
jgi:hypothetical protein